jgi:D-lyxose ketol-isomerase
VTTSSKIRYTEKNKLQEETKFVMKRSEINDSIDKALAFFDAMQFPLPEWARWSPEDWIKAGTAYKQARDLRLGWDVTDFGSGTLAQVGRTIFTLRNGKHGNAPSTRTYAEKVMCLFPGQKSVIHAHRMKCEDIICRGGGKVMIQIWDSDRNHQLSPLPVTTSIDGNQIVFEAGTTIALAPGMSICLPPRTFHRFWGEGKGPTLSVEISSVCDDLTDNLFLNEGTRFPVIEEDEERRWVLCSEYDSITE